MPKSSHGLRFKRGESILECGASLDSGTFTDYMDHRKLSWNRDSTITLRETLAGIIEIWHEMVTSGTKTVTHVQPVHVDARLNGDVALWFPHYPRELARYWMEDFPNLRQKFAIDPTMQCVRAVAKLPGGDSAGVSALIQEHLLPHLMLTKERPMWWLLRETELEMRLDRLSFYYVAMFILGSAVRYEPELVLNVSATDSGVGWLLRRFVSKAERYFPQLLLCLAWDHQTYM